MIIWGAFLCTLCLIWYNLSYFTHNSYWSFLKFVCSFGFRQDWDKPETIPDPDAKKPDDWDEEMDGEWEPPMVTNPDYKVHKAPVNYKDLKYNSFANFSRASYRNGI